MILNTRIHRAMAAALLLCTSSIACQSTERSLSASLPGGEAAPAQRRDRATIKTDALVYAGNGTAAFGAEALAGIVGERGMTYDVVSSDELNSMSLEEIASYGVIVWPGGKAGTMEASLTEDTKRNIRDAIQVGGVGYAGFCAGAFIAGIFADRGPTWGLRMIPWEFFLYDPADREIASSEMVEISFPDGSSREIAWIGGPDLTGFGQVIGKYDDGKPAMAQSWVGNGLVLLSGPHPEAPPGWKAGLYDADGADDEKAWELISAAYRQEPLQAF